MNEMHEITFETLTLIFYEPPADFHGHHKRIHAFSETHSPDYQANFSKTEGKRVQLVRLVSASSCKCLCNFVVCSERRRKRIRPFLIERLRHGALARALLGDPLREGCERAQRTTPGVALQS